MVTLARIGWILGSALASGASATVMAWYMLSLTLAGFNTSQQTLSNQMAALQGSISQINTLTADQLAEGRGNLTDAIASLSASIKVLDTSLGSRIDENNKQLAALNASIQGIDARLSDTIKRQESVEAILLKQRVQFGPPPNSLSGIKESSAAWNAAGYDVSPLLSFDDAKAVIDWQSHSNLLK